jgi:hypothetical protein
VGIFHKNIFSFFSLRARDMTYYRKISSAIAFGGGGIYFCSCNFVYSQGVACFALGLVLLYFVNYLPVRIFFGFVTYLGFLMAVDALLGIHFGIHRIYGFADTPLFSSIFRKRRDGTQNFLLGAVWLPILFLESIVIYFHRVGHDFCPVCTYLFCMHFINFIS